MTDPHPYDPDLRGPELPIQAVPAPRPSDQAMEVWVRRVLRAVEGRRRVGRAEMMRVMEQDRSLGDIPGRWRHEVATKAYETRRQGTMTTTTAKRAKLRIPEGKGRGDAIRRWLRALLAEEPEITAKEAYRMLCEETTLREDELQPLSFENTYFYSTRKEAQDSLTPESGGIRAGRDEEVAGEEPGDGDEEDVPSEDNSAPKSLDEAAAATLARLADVLGCSVPELLRDPEYVVATRDLGLRYRRIEPGAVDLAPGKVEIIPVGLAHDGSRGRPRAEILEPTEGTWFRSWESVDGMTVVEFGGPLPDELARRVALTVLEATIGPRRADEG